MANEISILIRQLRFPLAVLVVYIHSFGSGDCSVSLNFSGYNVYNIIRITISHVIATTAVPTFFVISGFLFFKGLETWDLTTWKEKIKRRSLSLLIPYILWITIRIIYERSYEYFTSYDVFCITTFVQHMTSNIPLFGYYWFYAYAGNISVPFHVPFWFIRDLISISFLTPAIYWITKHWGYFYLVLLALFLFSLVPQSPYLNYLSFTFFTAGAYIAIKQIDYLSFVLKYLKVFIILFVILGIVQVVDSSFSPFSIICGIPVVFGLAAKLNEKSRRASVLLSKLSEFSFFIYAFHIFALRIISFCGMEMSQDDNSVILILKYISIPFIATLLSISLYLLMKRYAPQMLKFLCGR